MINKFRIGILIFSLAVFLFPNSTFAASSKAIVTVEVNLSKVYVAMYNVSVVNDEWWGKIAQVKKVPANKKSVKFTVKPGQVVDFKIFETAEDVRTNKKRQFYSPPQKNFEDGDSGKLCMVAGVDFSKKLGVSPCVDKIELIYSGSDEKVSVTVNDGVDYTKPLSGVAVGMYNIAIVDNEWWGELAQVKVIPAGKELAVFSVTPGQIVDFLAFKDMGSAKKIQKHQFTVPPHKNFSGEYGEEDVALDGFCLIAGVDIAKKLELDSGMNSCGNEVDLVLEE